MNKLEKWKLSYTINFFFKLYATVSQKLLKNQLISI